MWGGTTRATHHRAEHALSIRVCAEVAPVRTASQRRMHHRVPSRRCALAAAAARLLALRRRLPRHWRRAPALEAGCPGQARRSMRQPCGVAAAPPAVQRGGCIHLVARHPAVRAMPGAPARVRGAADDVELSRERVTPVRPVRAVRVHRPPDACRRPPRVGGGPRPRPRARVRLPRLAALHLHRSACRASDAAAVRRLRCSEVRQRPRRHRAAAVRDEQLRSPSGRGGGRAPVGRAMQ